jgi:uncharacterized PurR-regulated membrane protein YhhQ (DUF165 family)
MHIDNNKNDIEKVFNDSEVTGAFYMTGSHFKYEDYAQKEIGHKVIIAMGIGAFLSYIMADPYVAIASLIAFAVSETIDWSIFTFTKKPLHKRILISSLISTPIDSALFLYIIGHFSILATTTMFVSKMIAALIIYYYLEKKDNEYIQL